MLYDVATTAVATFGVRDVARNGLDFGGCILGAAGQSATTHHLDIGYVIAYVENLFVLQAVAVAEVNVVVYLDGRADVDILRLQSEGEETLAYRFGTCTGDDAQQQPHLGGLVEGIAILDVNSSHGFTLDTHRYHVGTQYAIHIEQQRLDLC